MSSSGTLPTTAPNLDRTRRPMTTRLPTRARAGGVLRLAGRELLDLLHYRLVLLDCERGGLLLVLEHLNLPLDLVDREDLAEGRSV